MLFSSTIAAVSVDCAKVISFALGLNMNITSPARMNALRVDCCTDPGITCDMSSRVTNIDWRGLGLTGSMNSSAIPSSLQQIYLSSNQITGTIPPTFPDVLRHLMLDYNLLTGSIPPLPASLEYLYANGNMLTGTIPNPLPSGLAFFWVQNNQLSGKMPNPMPQFIIDFMVNDNQFSGDLPPLNNAQWLEISYSLSDKNKFTGVLIVDTPMEIFMVGNYITNVIIVDKTQLTQGCDLSYNPLKGKVNLLTMCTTTGIYSASLLPKTIGVSILVRATSATTTSSKLATKNVLTSPSSQGSLFTSPMTSTVFSNNVVSSSIVQEQRQNFASELQTVTTDLSTIMSCNYTTNIAVHSLQSPVAQFLVASTLSPTPILKVEPITSTNANFDLGQIQFETALPLSLMPSELVVGLMVLRLIISFFILSVILNKLNTRRILKQVGSGREATHFSIF